MSSDVKRVERPVHEISNIEIIGNFSVDGNRKYLNDLSQLKYYKEPADIDNVNFNLDENQNTVTKSNVHKKLDFTLSWILENIDILRTQDFESSKRWLEPEFIFNRGILTKLLVTPYTYKNWIICASKFKGTIYLCNFYTDEQLMEELNKSERNKRQTSWGFKFEQCVRSESPNADPDVSVPLDENEEFYCVFKSKFGNKTLLYAAEIDGISSQEVINNTVVGKELELLEFKTAFFRNLEDDKVKNSITALHWWAQSYAVNISNIVCGCKTNIGQVKRVIKYKLSDLDHCIKDKQKVCKIFCNNFLDFIKETVEDDYDKCLYKFSYNMKNQKITINEMDPDETSEYTFLYPRYIEKLKEHFPDHL
ncbi:unnamed protein product [Xylocopa violacea]|uniref:Decapping nuclease n=1 Tax=Xylocopa violacea TaxID=135666 RepID=A0ABP1NZU7_XYLVO